MAAYRDPQRRQRQQRTRHRGVGARTSHQRSAGGRWRGSRRPTPTGRYAPPASSRRATPTPPRGNRPPLDHSSIIPSREGSRRGCPTAVPSRPAARSLAAAPAAPLTRLSDPAGQDRAVALEALPDNLEAKLIQPGECGQVRANEGNVRHVEVFPMGSVRTPIIGRPRPLPSDRHAHHHYTLDCEEPPKPPTHISRGQGLQQHLRRPLGQPRPSGWRS